MVFRSRLVALLAAAPLVVAACSSGAAQQTATTTSSGQPAVTGAASPSAASPSVPPSLTPTTETSASPTASATVDPDAKVIYLTFDDGPWIPYTQQILDVLAKNDATATFFVVGEMVQQHPDLIRKIHEAGHAIGNHTWDHANLTEVSEEQVRWELRKTARAVGPTMAACMRPPYGATNETVRRITRQEGYRTILWTHWAVDWEQPAIPEFLGYLEDATQDKANILLHDGGGDRPNTVEAVRIMLPRWIKKGYTFQAVPQCLTPHRG